MDSIIDAAYNMGRVKTGALIVVEQAIHLTEYESTGIKMDCLVSMQVLMIYSSTTHHFTMALSLSVVTELYLRHVICHCLITWDLARSLEQGTEQR